MSTLPTPAIDVTDASKGVVASSARTSKAPVYFRTFNSVAAYIEHTGRPSAHNQTVIRNANSKGSGSGSRGGISWHGIDGGAPAVEAAVASGWDAGIVRLRAAFESIGDLPAPLSLKRKAVRGDHGDELDVHAVIRGDLSHAWTRRSKQVTVGRRVIKLVANVLDSAAHDAEQLFWRGAAALRLSELLIAAGYAVEIYAGYCIRLNTSKSWTVTDLIRVKDQNQPLNIPNVAAALCLAGFGRVYGFRALAHAADESAGAATGEGIGFAADLDTMLADMPDRYVTPRVNTAESAKQWITETIDDIQKAIKK